MRNIKIRKLTTTAVLACCALTIFVLEAQLPVIPVAGVKLGLSNLITLLTLRLVGRKEALAVVFIRVLLGNLYAGTFLTFWFSLAGGVLAWAVMALTCALFEDNQIWVVSVFGALAHNTGQLGAAAVLLKTASVLAYTPVLGIAAIVTGLFTGFLCVAILKSPVRRFSLKDKKPL